MKMSKLWMLAAILVCGTALVGCGNSNTKEQPKDNQVEAETPATPEVTEVPTCFTAVDDYLVNEIGKNYGPSEVSIPYSFVIATDEGNPEDILFWGDFWLFNYDLAGDTLKTVSGGSHPGLMHVRKTDNGYEVFAFDAVADGADNMPSAQKIFGDHFDAFWELNSDAEKREEMRLRFTSDYVKKHNLQATVLQDYGWPAVVLPE